MNALNNRCCFSLVASVCTTVLLASAVAAEDWKLVETVTPKHARRTRWNGKDAILLQPVDRTYAGKVFAADAALPKGDFDISCTLTFYSSSAPNPCRLGFVLSDDAGKTQTIEVRADGVDALKLPRLVYNAYAQDFLLKFADGRVAVYWAEKGRDGASDAAFSKLGTEPLAVKPTKINFRTAAGHHLHFGNLEIRPAAPVPLRRTGGLVAAAASREQPLVGGTVTTAKGKISLPLAGRHTLRLAFDKSPSAGILYLTPGDGKQVAFPIYLLKDSFTFPCDIPPVVRKGEKWTFENARISIGWMGSQAVVPMLKAYASNRGLTEDGRDFVREWSLHSFDARRHVLSLDIDCRPDGEMRIWADGSYLHSFRNVKDAYLWHGVGCHYRLDERPPLDERFLPLDFAANPRARTFANADVIHVGEASLPPRSDASSHPPTVIDGVPYEIAKPLDSQDVGLAKMCLGEWSLGKNRYRDRSPTDGYPSAIHYRLPPAHYIKAHVIYALDPDPKKKKTMRLRLARYGGGGCGSNMVFDTPVDLSGEGRSPCRPRPRGSVALPIDTVPGDRPLALPIGTVRLGDKSVDLCRVSVDLPAGDCLDFATSGSYIDFEAVGEKDDAADSAVNLFAVTLEKSPVVLDFKQECAGNVFTLDETGKKTTAVVRFKDAFKGTLAWELGRATLPRGRSRATAQPSLVSLDGKAGEVREVEIPLDGMKDVGLYELTVTVKGGERGGQTLLTHVARAAVLPPAGRLADANPKASPYCTWYFHNVHGGVTNLDWGYSFIRKLGLHKVTWAAPTPEMAKKYNLLGNGAVQIARPDFFDYAKGAFKPKDGLDGEAAVVADLKAKIARNVWTDHVNVWHENAPPEGVPEEVLGLPVPAATDADRRYAAYFNECGRILRKHFPNLRTKVGNSLGSSGACFRPFRGGAKPEYFDTIGMEPVNATVPPESMLLGTLQGMQLSKAAAEHYLKHPAKADACFEFISRPLHQLGGDENLQARLYMRDALVSLANGFTLIDVGGPFDGDTSYHDTVWGSGACCFRKPYLYPKQLCVAFAVLTKAIDAPTEMSKPKTDEKGVYALSFRRGDGRYATALWTTRGEAEVAVPAKGIAVSMLGAEQKVGGWFQAKTLTVSECPTYFYSDAPVTAVKTLKRRFPREEALASHSSLLTSHSSLLTLHSSLLTLSPDPAYETTKYQVLPVLKPSSALKVRDVTDAERGACVEVYADGPAPLKSKFVAEYTTLRFKEPIVLPKDARQIGVWVKGDSGRGQIRFEIEDACGSVYKNIQIGGGHSDHYDHDGRMTVDYDGWSFLAMPFDRIEDNRWYKTKWGKPGPRLAPPVKVNAITVSVNRFTPVLDEMVPNEPRVRISEVKGVK